MSRLLVLALASAVFATPAVAQDHAGHGSAPAAKPTAAPEAQDHSGHDMSGMPTAPASSPAPAVDPHAGHAMAPATEGADDLGPLPVSDEAVAIPPPPKDHAADQVFGAAAMDRSRAILAMEHGGMRVSQVRASIFEWGARSGEDSYRWDVEAWYGGDLNRLVVKTEGDGVAGGKLEEAEVQLLYSRAVARYTDLQAGIQQDIGLGASRTYLTAGFETMLPYWFEVEGAAFLSDTGDVFARVEASYDLRLTQRLVLQPQAELAFAAQDVQRDSMASGLTDGAFGLRLRYEIRREFAPYIGVSRTQRFGGSADLARAAGHSTGDTAFVVGLRAWF